MNVIKQLANSLGKNELEVKLYLIDAPKKYRIYTIPKRKLGHRVIAQPTKQLKIYQKSFIKIFNFPDHHSAMAYKSNIGIKENAKAHSLRPYLLKMDLENFFNSITNELFWDSWKKLWPMPNSTEKLWLERLIFWNPSKKPKGKLVLSVGAPSSPAISNFCLFLFDEMLSKECNKLDIVYTRYADDLTFSTFHKNVLFSIPSIIQLLLTQCIGRKLTINHGKTVFSSKAHNRHVTGITINNEGYISLGRERKRYIKHLVNQFKYNKLDKDAIKHLQGLLSFANHIEITFIESLEKKYSDSLITKIRKMSYE